MNKSFILLSLSFIVIFILTANIYFSRTKLAEQVNKSWVQHQLSYEKNILVMNMFATIEQISREFMKAIQAEDEFDLDEILQEISSLRGQYIQFNINLQGKNLDAKEQKFIKKINDLTQQGRESQIELGEILQGNLSLEDKMNYMIKNVFLYQTQSQYEMKKYTKYLEQKTMVASTEFKNNNQQMGNIINNKITVNLFLISILGFIVVLLILRFN